MPRSIAIVLLVSLAALSLGQQQHAIETEHKHAYNITLDVSTSTAAFSLLKIVQFDDLPTNKSGVGFHPTNPKEKAFHYNDVFFQSFTLLNASSANISSLDKQCSRSWPNSIFASRKAGYAWPRISIHDLSLPPSDLAESIRNSHRTFGLVSLWLKPVGNITGSVSNTLGTISATMMRLNPDPRGEPLPPGTLPEIVQGEPVPLPIGSVSGFGVMFPPSFREGLPLNLRAVFGPTWGTGVDVMEITSQILRKNEETMLWEVAEDWEVCLDDIKLEIVDRGTEKSAEPGVVFHGLRADGTVVGTEDWEWEVIQQIAGAGQL